MDVKWLYNLWRGYKSKICQIKAASSLIFVSRVGDLFPQSFDFHSKDAFLINQTHWIKSPYAPHFYDTCEQSFYASDLPFK